MAWYSQMSQSDADRGEWSPGETYIRAWRPSDEPEGQLAPDWYTKFVDFLAKYGIDRPEAGSPTWGWGKAMEATRDAPESIGMGATGPLNAGLIQWTKNLRYPHAYLHRSIGGAGPTSAQQELEALSTIFDKGLRTQAPTSMVTPGYLSTFHNSPAGGLMFSINKPEEILHAAPYDLWSVPSEVYYADPMKRMRYEDAITHVITKMKTGDERELGTLKRLGEVMRRETPEVDTPMRAWRPTGLGPFDQDVAGWPKKDWHQLGNTEKEQYPVETFLQKQMGGLNEVIPSLGRANLAGVRLPWDWRNLDSDDRRLAQLLRDFGQDYKLPVFRWPDTQYMAKDMLQSDPARGVFGYPKGKDYITSSRLPEFWGIREGDLP